ncbi:immunomodulatory protein (plasmid) [Bacillus thuringiensis serovar tolworthi]|uniref:Immunomodulatory protein n=3 Tax=Bacillus cereus group TaxID=86661 RepID=A0A9W4A1S8_BACTO|nr:hypothetical protein [Bacillus thuringiensis]MEB9595772.1 hypothetical protein [Bacillus cereus]BAR87698.1 immunomodulatory protein [Bacillus thuringiensis serovar tolworthi]
MVKVYDYQNKVMKTGVLYGISHISRKNYWLSPPYCLTNNIEDYEYGFCTDGRLINKKPIFAFKFYTDEWLKGLDIDTENEYFIQQHSWDEKNQKYVEMKGMYLKVIGTSSIFNSIRNLISEKIDSNNPEPYKFQFFNSEGLNVKIGFKDGHVKYDRFFISAVPKFRSTNIDSSAETVRYYSNDDIDNLFSSVSEMRALKKDVVRHRAECFIFDPVDIYLRKEKLVARVGEKLAILEFWNNNGILQVDIIKNGNQQINQEKKDRWWIYADGKLKFAFDDTEIASELASYLNNWKIKGVNFIVSNKTTFEIARIENLTRNLSILILQKVGDTLLATIEGDEDNVVSTNPGRWNIFVNGELKYWFDNQEMMYSVRNSINQSPNLKGESLVVYKADSPEQLKTYEQVVAELIKGLYKNNNFQELNKEVTSEKINEVRLANQYVKDIEENAINSELIERAEMLYDGDKLKIKVKTNGRTLEDSILIGLNHIAKKFIAVDLQNSAGQSTSPRQADTHYSFTLYEEGTKNILKTVSVQKGENIDGFIKEINKMYFLYGDIVKFYHSDGYNESILDVYNDNIKESERFARIRYFIVTEKGFQGIFHIKNWETTSYYVDGITFSEVPQGKKMKYRVVLNGNDIGTSYPYQTNGKGTDTILFTQDYYDMDGWGVSKYDNHIVVFAIDPDTGLEYEIAHHEPSQTRGDLEIPEECRHHNIQVNFYNSTCNIYLSKKR